MALTHTPRGPHSRARDLVSDATRGLARRIGRDFEKCDEARDRGDVNDSAVATLQHVPPEDLCRAQRAGQIGFEDGVPVFLSEVEGWPALRTTRAIDQDVNFTESFDSFGENLVKAGAILDIGRTPQRTPT